MSNSRRVAVRRIAVLAVLSAIALCVGACTLLLTKEPLSCSTNADCAKFGSAICDPQSLECVGGTASQIDSGGADTAASDTGATDSGPGFDAQDPCSNPNKPLVEIKGDITTNLTLKCDQDYMIIGRVAITPPFTMTIGPGTTIYGDPRVDVATNSVGTLVVPPGSRLVAVGTADSPVIFTSGKKKGGVYVADGGVTAGDWGGIYMFGEAPINTPTGLAEKTSLAPWGKYGGSKPANDSGRLEYVRIEYAGAKLPDGQDGTSLDLGGVGDQTTIDHVMVRFSANDCYEVLGGRVNLKHILCQYPADDGIAWDNGWTGKVQFLVVQGRPGIDDSANGLQGRSGAPPATPVSDPIIYNATFAGQNISPGATQQFGVRVESYSRLHLYNAIISGWLATLDFRGTSVPVDVGDGGPGGIEFRNSVANSNLQANVAYDEVQTTGGTSNPLFDDDNGFDEKAWWLLPSNQNSEANPALPKLFDPISPVFANSTSLGAVWSGNNGDPHAVAPPNDGFFDHTAQYIGAFKDSADTWAKGKWVVWNKE